MGIIDRLRARLGVDRAEPVGERLTEAQRHEAEIGRDLAEAEQAQAHYEAQVASRAAAMTPLGAATILERHRRAEDYARWVSSYHAERLYPEAERVYPELEDLYAARRVFETLDPEQRRAAEYSALLEREDSERAQARERDRGWMDELVAAATDPAAAAEARRIVEAGEAGPDAAALNAEHTSYSKQWWAAWATEDARIKQARFELDAPIRRGAIPSRAVTESWEELDARRAARQYVSVETLFQKYDQDYEAGLPAHDDAAQRRYLRNDYLAGVEPADDDARLQHYLSDYRNSYPARDEQAAELYAEWRQLDADDRVSALEARDAADADEVDDWVAGADNPDNYEYLSQADRDGGRINPRYDGAGRTGRGEWDVALASQVEQRLEQDYGRDALGATDPESVGMIADARDRIAAELDAQHRHHWAVSADAGVRDEGEWEAEAAASAESMPVEIASALFTAAQNDRLHDLDCELGAADCDRCAHVEVYEDLLEDEQREASRFSDDVARRVMSREDPQAVAVADTVYHERVARLEVEDRARREAEADDCEAEDCEADDVETDAQLGDENIGAVEPGEVWHFGFDHSSWRASDHIDVDEPVVLPWLSVKERDRAGAVGNHTGQSWRTAREEYATYPGDLSFEQWRDLVHEPTWARDNTGTGTDARQVTGIGEPCTSVEAAEDEPGRDRSRGFGFVRSARSASAETGSVGSGLEQARSAMSNLRAEQDNAAHRDSEQTRSDQVNLWAARPREDTHGVGQSLGWE